MCKQGVGWGGGGVGGDWMWYWRFDLNYSVCLRERGFCFLVRASTMRRVWRLRRPRVGTASSSDSDRFVRDLCERSVSISSPGAKAVTGAAEPPVAEDTAASTPWRTSGSGGCCHQVAWRPCDSDNRFEVLWNMKWWNGNRNEFSVSDRFIPALRDESISGGDDAIKCDYRWCFRLNG